jgi:molybdopterin/thiamine biosynthesis adenylyltransferase
VEEEPPFRLLPRHVAEVTVSDAAGRFARHELIPGWSQARLASRTVVVAGAGALGNAVAEALALAGVGRLVLCDPDAVAASNLSRTPLFRPGDVGRLKVHAAAEALRALSPSVEVDPRPLPLVNGVGLAELRDAALTIGCLDSRAARLELAGRCALVRAPWIDGATGPWSGEVRPYLDPGGPCYGCSLSARDRAASDVPWSCLDPRPSTPAGASAPVSALVGGWMSVLAVRALLGLPVEARTLSIDAARGTTEAVRTTRAADCPFHAPLGEVETLALGIDPTAGALAAALGPGRRALSWSPVLCGLSCPRGDHARETWGRPRAERCPACGSLLRPRTTLELDRAPAETTLRDLGVAPREILAVTGQGKTSLVELT